MTYLAASLKVLKLLKENGFEAYLVGGFVRDYLLGIPSNDIDITTNALPEEMENIFPCYNKGIKYNSVVINYEGYHFEVTTYRLDLAYTDYRHPKCMPAKTLREDLTRRDFTINAIAMDENFKTIDLFNGMNDLKAKLIRTINEPTKRFNEDALRMLRACYFAAKLNFTIEPKTLEAIKKCAYLLQHLTLDRITWELEKLMKSDNALVGIKYLEEANLRYYLGPYKETIYLMYERQIILNWLEFLTLTFYDNLEEINNVHFKNGESAKVKGLVNLAHLVKDNSYNSYLVFNYGLSNLLIVNKINMLKNNALNREELIRNLDRELVIRNRLELNIKAQTIKEKFPTIKESLYSKLLDDILKAVLTKRLSNDEEKIIKFIRKQQNIYIK